MCGRYEFYVNERVQDPLQYQSAPKVVLTHLRTFLDLNLMSGFCFECNFFVPVDSSLAARSDTCFQASDSQKECEMISVIFFRDITDLNCYEVHHSDPTRSSSQFRSVMSRKNYNTNHFALLLRIRSLKTCVTLSCQR